MIHEINQPRKAIMSSFTNPNFSKTVEEGRIEVARILRTSQRDHVGVLGIKDKSEYRSDNEFKNAVLDAFVRVGMLTNPTHNKTEDSYNAFKRKFDHSFSIVLG